MNRTSTRLSRRAFTRVLSASVAYASLKRSIVASPTVLRLADEFRSATEVVRLSSNENPYGPSPKAFEAMTGAFDLAWRYPDESAEALVDKLAHLNGVSNDKVLLGNGSGEILKLAAAAFTGPGRQLVIPEPTFEAIASYARTAQAEIVKVRLTSSYKHDLPRMLASNASLIYVCNPNNPTASITPKKEIREFVSKVPSATIVLIDEAYHHYADSDEYETVMPLVKQYSNLIVVRTFSKIYGMAGLRCGYCVAQPGLIRQLRSQQTWDSVNIMALMAATASLADSAHVEQGQLRNRDVKRFVYSELEKLGYQWIPSQANFLMIDLRKDVRPIIAALRERKVEVGRFFPALPKFMRVTIGTRPQMESFVAALREVMS